MYKYILYIALSLLVYIGDAFGQDKVERERRIKRSEVPENAREWMRDAFEGLSKVRWYYEETSGSASYEAKLRWGSKRVSVEFDTSGVVEDIEMEIDFGDLSPEVKNTLEDWFDSNYRRYDLKRIQEQWTGDPDDLEDAVDEDEVDSVVIKYEIEYYSISDDTKALWEGLFDATGNFINKRKIILRPTDNLNF